MAESIFLAAWATGIVEGGSVLRHYAQQQPNASTSNKHSSNDGNVASLLLPSIIYGTAAMPMSVIGESPGPALLLLLPMSPKIEFTPKSSSADDNLQPLENFPLDSNNLSMIELARKENRIIMARQKQSLTAAVPNWSHYFATLSGNRNRALQPPLAESMRRIRLLLVGAGLISWYWQYQQQHQQQQQQENHSPKTATSSMATVDSFVQSASNTNPGGGVVLRLVHQPQRHVTNGRLPIVCTGTGDASSPSMITTFPQLLLEDAELISNTNEKWLLRTNEGKPFCLVEANISFPLAQCFAPEPSNSWIGAVLFAIHRIEALARKSEAETVSVLVGSGPSSCYGGLEDAPLHSIYLDGLIELAETVCSMVDRFQEMPSIDSVGEVTEDCSAINDEDEGHIATSSTPDIFESIGLWIRRGLQFSTNSLTRLVLVPTGERRVLHVISDNSDFVRWASGVFSNYKIVRTNPTQKQEMQDYLELHDAPSLVCCSNDEQTSLVLRSIVAQDNNTSEVVALMDKEWMKRVTAEMMDEIRPKNVVQMVTLEATNKATFSRVQELLVLGHNPEEIQSKKKPS
jgi:hypothetical protein